MTTPELTKEQRREGFERALRLRRARADLKAVLTAGDAVLEAAWEQPVAQGMKVVDLLRALPGIGDVKAAQLLEAAGIPEKNTVRACGKRQTDRLFEALKKI